MNKPNLSPWERQHHRHLDQINKMVDEIYKEYTREAALIASMVRFGEDMPPFEFKNFLGTKYRVDKLMRHFTQQLKGTILKGIDASWALSEKKNAAMLEQLLGKGFSKLSEEEQRRFLANTERARAAFKQRKEDGMSLSERVWRYREQFQTEIEMGIDIGLRDGLSADEMSRSLREYLKEPKKLFRRVRDVHGMLHLSKRAAAYHPGRGVYRSSYKNARRLAATETNIAYRTADFNCWQDLDFVVGIKIALSNNHTLNGQPFEDICDHLQGEYPKDFKFVGWHPLCRCHAEAIVKTIDEQIADTEKLLNGEPLNAASENAITELPKQFTDWVQNSKERIQKFPKQPYFLRDNWGKVLSILEPNSPLHPPFVETYISMHNGRVLVSPLEIGHHELEKNLRIAKFIADQTGQTVFLLPELKPDNKKFAPLRATHHPKGVYPNKNPDMMIGGEIYEAKAALDIKDGKSIEGQKGDIEKRYKKAKEQASNIILELPEHIEREAIHRAMRAQLSRSQVDRVVFVKHEKELLIYTNKEREEVLSLFGRSRVFGDQPPRSIAKVENIFVIPRVEKKETAKDIAKEHQTSGVTHIRLTTEQKAYRKHLQDEAKAQFSGMVVENQIPIRITTSSIKEFLNQPHKEYWAKNELVRDLPKLIQEAEYLGAIHYHKGNPGIDRSFLFQTSVNGNPSILIVRRDKAGEYMFHSISDKINIIEKPVSRASYTGTTIQLGEPKPLALYAKIGKKNGTTKLIRIRTLEDEARLKAFWEQKVKEGDARRKEQLQAIKAAKRVSKVASTRFQGLGIDTSKLEAAIKAKDPAKIKEETRIVAKALSEKQRIVKKAALNVSKVAEGYKDLDSSALKAALESNNMAAIQRETKLLAKGIGKLKQEDGKDKPHPAIRKEYRNTKEIDATFKVINDGLSDGKWFEKGDLVLKSTRKRGINGFTFGDGQIFLTPSRLTHVAEALGKIGQGKSNTITFLEADAMATFWHEITHNRNIHVLKRLSPAEVNVMELMNEFVARKTLPDFYKTLGVSKMPYPEFQNTRKSTGYDKRVIAYDYVIESLALDKKKVLESAKKGLFNCEYSEQLFVAMDALRDGGLDSFVGANGKSISFDQLREIVDQCTEGKSIGLIRKYLKDEGII